MKNIWDEALKELHKEYPSGFIYTYFVMIFQKPDRSYHWVFTSQHMLKEIDRLVQDTYPASAIRYIGFLEPSEKKTEVAVITGHICEWQAYKSRNWIDPTKESIYKVVMDQYQPI